MDNEYLKRIYGLLESGATLGTGAVSGLVGLPYGLYKGVTSGAYGTPEAPRIAAREAQQFMERNTYQPRSAEGQANLQQLAGLLEASKLPPVMPEASLLAAIPKQAYAAQAERAGMAAEKAIEPAVRRTMERGGLPAQLLGDLSQGSIRPMDVWHGSPHGPFEKFDPTKIGSGEGAQAYSYGHYLGEARGTGEEYRKALTGNHNLDQFVPTVDGQPTDSFVAKAIIREGGRSEPFIAKMQSKLEKQIQGLEKASKQDELGLGVTDYDIALMDVNKTQKIIDEASSYIGKTVKNEQPGYLYKVDLPDEAIANMLDWDKPVSKQSKKVQDALKNSNVADMWKAQYGFDIEKNQPQMDMVYKAVAEQLGSDAAASQYFKDLGIPGMRYKDAGSRNIESGTSNFVVFPGGEDLLTIKEINDKPVGGLLGQAKSAPISSLSDIENKFKDIALDVYEKNGTINLSRIVVPKDMRSSGVGSSVMSDLTSYADQTGQKMALTPSDSFGGNVKRLKDFYKQFGFVENKGKNKDFSTMETMIRLPETRKEPKELTNLLD